MAVLRRMTVEEFESWLAHTIPVYAAEKVASGQWSESDAVELSRKEHTELLPLGIESKGCHFFSVLDPDGKAVGSVWFAEKVKFSVRIAYVFDIEINSEHRRKGYARSALQALEEEVSALGLHGVALHVFGHNLGARELYAGLGYELTNINLFKHVRASA